ncbi:MAG: bifunctional nuclease family protein [bacterium]
MLVEMKVAAIAEDEIFKTPIVILKALNSRECLPIWVGPFEGQAIEYGLKGNQLLRPLPYDTILKIFQLLNVRLEKVVINNLLNNTFYAIMVLNKDGSILEIDSRPSDAIAIAVRWNSPIFVSEDVIQKAVSIDIGDAAMETPTDVNADINLDQAQKDKNENKKKWKEWLMKLRPEDFGKYEM